MPEPSLQELQEWMSIVVEHQKDAAAGSRSKAAHALIPQGQVKSGKVVLPNDRMDVFSRLDVYNGGYFARLKEVLESDFIGLVHALGEHPWFHLALDYVQRHPSRHPNLNQFNRQLPEFIASRKQLLHRSFLRDLAMLEVAMTKAFDAPEFEPMDMNSLQGLTPEEWEQVVFTLNPSLQILKFSYPVNPYLQAVFDGKEPDIPTRQNSYVAVYRKEDRVWRHDLPRPLYLALSALAQGQPLQTALLAGGKHDLDLSQYFASWSGDGFFTAARLAP